MSEFEARVYDRRAHVQPRLSGHRIDRAWRAVREGERTRSRGRRAARWAVPALLGAVAIGALVVYVTADSKPSPMRAGTSVSTHTSAIVAHLRDGSKVELEPRSKVTLARSSDTAIDLELVRGTAWFDVAHDPARAFTVRADDVAVRVVGTRFKVARTESQTSGASASEIVVAVERGVVEVTHAGALTRLRSGQSGSFRATQLAVRTSPTTSASHVRPAPLPAASRRAKLPAAIAADDTQTTTAARSTVDDAQPRSPTPNVRGPVRSKSVRSAPSKSVPRTSTATAASLLFDQAASARRRGEHAVAARKYQAFLDGHSQDARAGLAAFELGRLRMDSLNDPRGAARSLTRSLQLNPRSPFREDTMARLVRSLEAAGDRDACQSARRAYLDDFADGRYRQDIDRRCRPGKGEGDEPTPEAR